MDQEHCKMREEICKDAKANESIKEIQEKVVQKEDIEIWYASPKDRRCIMYYEVRPGKWKQPGFDGRRRARLVANGKVTIGPPEEDVWSGVILAADISSAYLMADTKEMMYTRLGPEFGD
eukprot:3331869-Ditylum_brightwellii.AAC.1